MYDVLGIQIEHSPKAVVKLETKDETDGPEPEKRTAEVRVEFRSLNGELLKYRTCKIPFGTKKVIEAEEIKGYHLVGLKTKEIAVDAKGQTTSPVTFSYGKDQIEHKKKTGCSTRVPS